MRLVVVVVEGAFDTRGARREMLGAREEGLHEWIG
tara:strand:+ start:538 stop:642 length:105 start_codon:yes stop_codon:yes gene_type:complete